MNYQRYSGDDLLLSLMALGSEKSAMHKIWMEHIQNLNKQKSTKETSGEVKSDTYEWMSKIFLKLSPRAVESVLSRRNISANFLETASVTTETENIKGAHYDTPSTNSDYGYFVVELKKDGKSYLKLKLNGEKIEDTTKPYLALIVSTMVNGNEKTRYLFIEEKRSEKLVGGRVVKDIRYRTIGSDTLELTSEENSNSLIGAVESFENHSKVVVPKTNTNEVLNKNPQVSSGADNSFGESDIEGQITKSEASNSSGQNSDHIQSQEPNTDEDDDHEWDTWYKRPTKRSKSVIFEAGSNAKTPSTSAPNITAPTVSGFVKVNTTSSKEPEDNKSCSSSRKTTLSTEQKIMRTENGNYKVDDDGQITILF